MQREAAADHEPGNSSWTPRARYLLSPTLSDSGLIEIAVTADQRDPLAFAQLGHGTAALSLEGQIELIDEVGDGGGFSGGELGQS
jgi:hypothetical protein